MKKVKIYQTKEKRIDDSSGSNAKKQPDEEKEPANEKPTFFTVRSVSSASPAKFLLSRRPLCKVLLI